MERNFDLFSEEYIKSTLVYNHIQELQKKNHIIELLCPLYDKLIEKDKKQFHIDLETFIGKYAKKVDKILKKESEKKMKKIEKSLQRKK